MSTEPRWIFADHTSVPGGGELALVRYLQATSLADVEVLTLEDGDVWNPLREKSIPVTTLGPANALRTQLALRAYVRRNRDAVFVANTMRMALLLALARTRRTRIVYWVRDGLTDTYMSRAKQLLTRYVTLPRIAAAVANSQWTAGTVTALEPAMPIRVVPSPSGIDPDTATTSPRTLPTSGPVPIAFVARISEWKGPHIAIAAVDEVNRRAGHERVHLTVAGGTLFGENEFRDRFLAMVEASSATDYLGHTDDVTGLFASSAIMLHCSVTPEPFGQVVVQAMNAGLVVIATRGGGPSEIITPGVDGVLIEPDDPTLLADALEALLDTPSGYSSMSRCAVKRAADYSDDTLVARLDRSLRELSQIQKRR
ncbi:putative glycosyl transferase [Rhodococcoides trifolii]|uniref:Glycosyl transferase n=1 Tax=Rhodococcoides trifolii TaxID=908250 RepID=A0A917G455_9NOCA|nr:glycosyltransferase family 4 protein [Rhodococcus trifolii]GGG21730.1 putative glycosyl transferase [Rhodococcus trifolii]